MPPPSPRRSSRARVGSALPRGERSTRTTANAHKKSSPASASFDGLDDDAAGARRRKRLDDDDRLSGDDADQLDDDGQDEDDAVRCICGTEEYPGLPVFASDPRHHADAAFYDSIDLNEDVVGFFLQCDTCKVWQHGACVGIISTEVSPDEYFCEKCRKDLHRIHSDSKGQNYSHYLPTHRPSRIRASNDRSPKGSVAGSVNGSVAGSVAGSTASAATAANAIASTNPTTSTTSASPPQSQKEKSTRLATNAPSKRRSTMNSRDAAYDAEQLTLAIEASKEDYKEGEPRRPKRGRSESDEEAADEKSPGTKLTIASNVITVKRQRTSSVSAPSVSVSPSSEQHADAAAQDSDEGRGGRRSRAPSRAPSRSQREREREEDDKTKKEQSNKRKDRADRRRGDDLEPVKEAPAEPMAIDDPEPVPPPDTPPSKQQPPAGSHKKVANRSHQKKTRGRNQYTKDRDLSRDASPAKSIEPPRANNTHDDPKPDPKHTPRHKAAHTAHHGPKVSMLDMKRRAAAYLDFISRTQVELALDAWPSPGLGGDRAQPRAAYDEADFKELNSMEMMDVLTRRLVKWQNQYAE